MSCGERHSRRQSLLSVPVAHLKRIAELNAKIALKFDFESNPFVSINGHAEEITSRILLKLCYPTGVQTRRTVASASAGQKRLIHFHFIRKQSLNHSPPTPPSSAHLITACTDDIIT